jgi:hypothetical protein
VYFKDVDVFVKMLDTAAIDHAVLEHEGNLEVKTVMLEVNNEIVEFHFDALGRLGSVDVNSLPVPGA